MKKKSGKKKVPNKYDKIVLAQLETRVVTLHSMSRESQKEMYEILEYLRVSVRFRENPVNKKSTFWQYLDDRFTILENTFRQNVRAFNKYPEASVKHGVGLVAKIGRQCGGPKTKAVLSEIKAADEKRKTPLTRANIETIIQKHAKPKIEKKITDWQSMYHRELAAHDQTKESLRVAVARVHELSDQVEKLKNTALVVSGIRDVFEKQGVKIHQASA